MAENAKAKLKELKATIAKRKARAAQVSKDNAFERKSRQFIFGQDYNQASLLAAASTKMDRSRIGTGSTTSGKFLTGPLKPGESRTYSRAKAKAKK